MEQSSKIKIIFFDAAGTLFTVNGAVGEIYAQSAAKYGCNVSPANLEANFRRQFARQPPLAFAPTLATPERVAVEKKWWYNLVANVFSDAGNFAAFPQFFEDVFAYFAKPEAWQLAPDVIPTLQKLRAHNIRLGVISNFDTRLRHLLTGFSLTSYFSSLHISSEVGAAKPEAEIFRQALQKNNVGSHEALHVGDSWVEDILGATEMGLRCGWLAPPDAQRILPPSVRRLDRLADVLTMIGNI